MDQPTAEKALKEMERRLGEWVLEPFAPGGEPWRGEARAARSAEARSVAGSRRLSGRRSDDMERHGIEQGVLAHPASSTAW
jgi:hypothetical protein